jgi:peptide/nickel transport system substrate-binding protein
VFGRPLQRTLAHRYGAAWLGAADFHWPRSEEEAHVSDAKKRADQEKVDAIRRRSSPVQNHLIDEYAAGKVSRRDFIRRGTIVGMSLPFLGFIAAACSSDEGDATTTTAGEGETTTTAAGTTTTAAATTEAPSGPVTVRVGLAPPPSVGVEPVLINDEAGLSLLGQTAQYLTFSDDQLNVIPVLAESWEPNATFDEWTFNLRQGVMFNDGTEMTAADVVATFNGPIGTGNAGSAYGTYGVSPGAAAEAVDDYTVVFTLAAPTGAFPFFVSSDNYNAAILPESFWQSYETADEGALGSYEQSFVGTGPWLNESYDPGVSAVYTKNPNYWGDNANQPDRMEVGFFGDEAAMVTAFQDGRLDVLYRVSFTAGQSLADAGTATLSSVPTAQHRQIYMDTSSGPFADKRVRQALALSIDRELFIQGLLGGFGVVGNDHPIWEFFPMYNPDAVAQRTVDLDAAKALLAEAGLADGFSAPLDTLQFAEIEDLAQLVQASAAQIGIDLSINVTDSGTYYQDFWCSWPYEQACTPGAVESVGIVNYGHRGVPNVYLSSPLRSGVNDPLEAQWNSSHWVNTEYDALYAQWAAAPDLDVQRQLSGEMQVLLNEEVPIIVPYFIDFISATVPNFTGLQVTGMGHYDVTQGQFTG